jgi:hypothetical protein
LAAHLYSRRPHPSRARPRHRRADRQPPAVPGFGGRPFPAQWNFKPDEKTWSVAECAEHIALSEDLIFGSVTKIVQAPAAPDKKSAVTDDFILKAVVDRSHKFQAPEQLRPKQTFATPQEMHRPFQAEPRATIAYVRDTQDDLRGHFFDHPVLKTMDGYQWILLLSAHSHTAQHTAQLWRTK